MTIHFTKKEIGAITSNSNFEFDENGLLVLFVGHAHSGHSLIGAILDMHQQVCLANEVNIVNLINQYDLTAKQLEAVLYYAYSSNQVGWKNSDYKYNLKNGFQGVTERTTVLGDKKAGGTTRIFFNNLRLYEKLINMYGERLRIIYVERNPLDIIAAYSHYMKQKPSMFHVQRFNENLSTVHEIQKQTPKDQLMTIKQQDFIGQPLQQTLKLYDFLNVNVSSISSDIAQWVKVVRSDIKGKSESIHLSKDLISQINQ